MEKEKGLSIWKVRIFSLEIDNNKVQWTGSGRSSRYPNSMSIIFILSFLLKVKQNICAYCFRREIELLRKLLTSIF